LQLKEDKKEAEPQGRMAFHLRVKIALIHLNNPPANSYDHELYKQLEQAIKEVRFDSNIKVAVLVSDVPKFFSAGADIKFLREADPYYKTQFCLH